MVNNKLLEVLENIKRSKPRLMVKIINEYRLIYNNLCRECQIKLYQKSAGAPNASIDLNNVCEKCRPHVEERLKHINELVAGGQK